MPLYQRRKIQHELLGELRRILLNNFSTQAEPYIRNPSIQQLSDKLQYKYEVIEPLIFELSDDGYVLFNGLSTPITFSINDGDKNNGITAFNSRKFLILYQSERKEYFLKTFQLVVLTLTIMSLIGTMLFSTIHYFNK